MITTLIYYITIWKKRRSYSTALEVIGEVTLWNRKSVEKLAHDQFKFELAALGLWGISFAMETMITFSVIYTCLK